MRARKTRLIWAAGVAVLAVTAVVATAIATSGGNGVRGNLTGLQEDPLALSTSGNGSFVAKIKEGGNAIDYTLKYGALEGTITQSHIHLGGKAQSGGISVFFCSNLGNGPAGTPACPPAPA